MPRNLPLIIVVMSAAGLAILWTLFPIVAR